MRTKSTVISQDGTTWYYEQEGSGPDVVLIPDGVGDCYMFNKPMSLIASHGFRVTTFDMPGMSRSNLAPPETYQAVTAQKLAQSVVGILDALQIPVAIFWGSSSGAATVLALAAEFPNRVVCGMVHEAPTHHMEDLSKATRLENDEDISTRLAEQFPKMLIGDVAAWDALGKDFHARVWKNYARWARGYPITLPTSIPVSPADLCKRPLRWTVGASTPNMWFLDNVVIAAKNDIPISTIPGMHTPYVSNPEDFAHYVVDTARKFV